MSELQFPKDPTVGQEYDFAPYKYYWDGDKWKTKGIGYNPVNALRDELEPKISNNATGVFEALRRTYANAGLTLVTGSFEDGGILTKDTDVLLHEVSGKAYAWTGEIPEGGYIVVHGTDPLINPLYVDRSDIVGEESGGGGGGGDASTIMYTHAGVSTAVQTTVANMMQSMRFNLTEFLSDDLTISQSIKNMLTAANGAGCYIPDGVWTLEAPVAYTGTVKLLLGDNAVIKYQGIWLTVTDGDESIISGGILTTPTRAYMVNRWDSSYNFVDPSLYVYGYDLDQGYQISGNDPEYADYIKNHPEWVTYAGINIKLVRCDRSVVSYVRGKFVTIEFIDCEFSGAFRNNVHGGEDRYGSVAFKVAAKKSQRGNYAIQNIVRNNTLNGICWEGQVGFKCFQNQSIMNGESNFKRMQNTFPNVGCSIVDNDSHGAFYDGFDTFTNFPPTGSVTNKRYYVVNNRSTGCRNTAFAVEGTAEFIGNYMSGGTGYGLWAPNANACRFYNNTAQNCCTSSYEAFASVLISGAKNAVDNFVITHDAPVNYAFHIRGEDSTYSKLLIGSSYDKTVRCVGTNITGMGNRGVKSAAGTSLDNYLLTDFDNLDDSATTVGLGFRIRSASNSRVGKIATNLTVPSADKMYSEMLFAIRTNGSEVNAITLATPDTSNQSYMLLQCNIDGSTTSRRVKLGAAGTGPGGSGRMLYVDV